LSAIGPTVGNLNFNSSIPTYFALSSVPTKEERIKASTSFKERHSFCSGELKFEFPLKTK
jgi:hypothetical protein